MSRRLFVSAALLLAYPASAAPPPASVLAESKQAHSNVSVLVEPQLNDGRLVVRIAAKNMGTTPVSFGPSAITVAKPNGETIALYPLQSLVNDVKMAAGMPVDAPATAAPTQGAYASPQMGTRDGKVDVSGYTGGSAVGSDEYIHRNQVRRGKASISEAAAQTQIAALKQAILQDSMLPPGQIAAGQIVTDKLKFKKGEDRTLHLRIRMAGDEHGFTIEAPSG